MENPTQPYYAPPGPGYGQRDLPNAMLVLVLGIISIVMSCCCFGLVFSILALIFNGKDQKLYQENPQIYTTSSYSNLNIGRVCAIIGLIISIVVVIYFIVMFSLQGSLIMEQYKEIYQQMQNKRDESMLLIDGFKRTLIFI